MATNRRIPSVIVVLSLVDIIKSKDLENNDPAMNCGSGTGIDILGMFSISIIYKIILYFTDIINNDHN